MFIIREFDVGCWLVKITFESKIYHGILYDMKLTKLLSRFIQRYFQLSIINEHIIDKKVFKVLSFNLVWRSTRLSNVSELLPSNFCLHIQDGVCSLYLHIAV